ncbi:hypothetical protein, partial [Aphanothece microscopica]|uniref:hypothetical protein n=1 Tax=Aphanothece microscopica TaxID=1049561 RepID=UPI003984C312
MAEDGKKEFKAEIKCSAVAECDGKDLKYIEEKLPKKTWDSLNKKIDFSEKVMLDGRKWKQKDLDDGIYAVARYELKVFGTALGKRVDEHEGKKLDDKKFEDAVKKLHTETVKKIIEKVSLAIEELAKEGSGDGKKAAKDGNAAFKKLLEVDFDSFGVNAALAVKVLEDLEKSIKKGGKGASGFEKARTGFEKVNTSFEKDGKEAQAAVDFIMKKLREIQGDTKNPPNAVAFAKDFIKKHSSDFDKFLTDVTEFEKLLTTATSKMKGNQMDEKEVAEL